MSFAYGRARDWNAFRIGTITMAKAPVVPGKKKARAAARRPNLAKQVGIVLGSGTLLAAAVGAYLVFTHDSDPQAPATAPSYAAAPPAVDRSGAIIVKDAGGGCRRMTFNNANGAITDDGPAACPQGGPGASAASDALSGPAAAARFGQISAGFHK
jgi:hypothetical protein